MSKNIKIGKLAVFNMYCSDEFEQRFTNCEEKIDYCENVISQYITSFDSCSKKDYNRLASKISRLQEALKQISSVSGDKADLVVNSNEIVNKLAARITKLEGEVDSLKQRGSIPSPSTEQKRTFEDYDKIISQLATHIKEQDNKLNSLEKQLANAVSESQKQAEYISALEKKLNALTSVKSTSETPKTAPSAPRTKKSDFPELKANSKKVFITEKSSVEEVKEYIRKAIDITGMETALETSGIDDKNRSIYNKLLNSYQKELINDFNKINANELESDEISSTVICVVGKAVSRSVTDKIVTAVCDRIRRGQSEYKVFLNAINSYLESIGFYTEQIKIGENITKGSNSIHMNPVYTPTSDRTMHGIIYDIQTLPYLINFIDENENKDVYVCKGSCAVYRSE